MAFIPAPILWKAQIPLRRKLLVALLLFSGVFIVAAAIIRCVMSVGDIRHIGTSGVWAIRETFVSICAVNAPAIKPLFSRNRQTLGSNNKSSSGGKYGSRSNGTTQKVSRHTACEGDELELRSTGQWSGKDQESFQDMERGSSAVSVDDLPELKGSGLRIEVTKGFTMSSEEAQNSQGADEPRSWSEVAGHAVQDNMKTREGWTKIGESGRRIPSPPPATEK